MNSMIMSTYVESLIIEIGFIIFPSFYYGPENFFTEEHQKTMHESISPPCIPLYEEDRALTNDVVGNENELIQYYRTVKYLCKKYNKDLKRSYFWINPLLYNSEGIRVNFPYYDTYEDCKNIFAKLSVKKDGMIFWDCDMGWELSIHARGPNFYLHEWNPDTGKDYNTIYFSKLLIQEQIPALMQRTEAIISILTQALGTDYWSR